MPAGPAIQPVYASAAEREEGLIRLLPYQDESFVAPYRLSVDEWARQTGKTFKGSAKCLFTCITVRRAMVVTMSASLRQGELVIRKDAEVWRSVMTAMRKRYGQDSGLKDFKLISSPADDDRGRLLDIDAIADLLSTSRLSAKVQWGRAADDYAIHQIFAANPDTARGATGDEVFWDEAFLTPEFKECLRALRNMINRRPNATIKLASSPPISSAHESWELVYHEDTFPVCPKGNWRRAKAKGGERGLWIHRVDAYDAEAAGVKSYDEETGRGISIAEMRELSDDKDGMDRELLLKYISDGTALIPYSCLTRAQAQGAISGGGEAIDLGVISDLNELSDDGLKVELRKRIPITWAGHLDALKAVGLGHDKSTTDKLGKSNPSTFIVLQEDGAWRHMRLCVRWLSRYSRVNDALVDMLINDARAAGARLRGLGIDASNESFDADRQAKRYAPLLQVKLFKNGEKHPSKPGNWKDHLAGQYAQLFLDSIMTVPPDGLGKNADWLLSDHSLAVKGPSGVTWLTSKGNHGDTFAGAMLAEEMISGQVISTDVGSADGGSVAGRGRADSPGDTDGWLIGSDPDARDGDSIS